MSEPGVRFPEVAAAALGWITTAQMREVDRVMTVDLGVEMVQMMENAGRNLARLVLGRFSPSSVAVVAGSGGNAGGGLVAARHLANLGVDVTVVLAPHPADIRGVPAHQLAIVERMGVPVVPDPVDADVVVDALVGYGLVGPLRGRVAELTALLGGGPPVVSLDVPSGLDATTGTAYPSAVEAAVTLTLAAPKVGMRGSEHVGELYLADISVPPAVLVGVGVATDAVPDFSAGPVLVVSGA